MKHALYLTGLLALCCVAWFAVEGALTQRAARPVLAELKKTGESFNKKDGIIENLNSTIEVAHEASQKQADWYDPNKKGGATQQIQRTISSFKELAVRTDCNLNGGLECRHPVLPELAGALGDTAALARNATINLNDTSAKLQPILTDLGTASASLAQKTPVILDSLSQTSKETVTIAGNVAGATDDIHQTTHDVAAFTHRELAPVKGVWNTIKAILMEFAGPASQVATAIR